LTEKEKLPSTAWAHLKLFIEHEKAGPFVKKFRQYNATAKTLNTYIVGFMKHLRSDGRFHPSYVLAKGGGTNCFVGSQLILTSRGYIPAKAVWAGDSVISHAGIVRKVTGVLNNGIKPTARITLANGVSLWSTLNHPYATESGWVNAAALTVGMPVLCHSGPELWAAVAWSPNYRVSSWGRVENRQTGLVLAVHQKDEWGHLKVSLHRNKAKKRGPNYKDFGVHHLVAETFIGPRPSEKHEVRHLNGISWDNTSNNLAWGLSLENSADAIRHGSTSKRSGSQNKLTEEAVQIIRATPRYEKNNRQLASELGVSSLHYA
jgi:hypothetical protein